MGRRELAGELFGEADDPLGALRWSLVRAGVIAVLLLRAGTAALDAGVVDAGVETLRRAVQEAGRAGDPATQAEVQRALGSALIHAIRGSDGEGAVVLHRALLAARAADRPALAADILPELAFADARHRRQALAARPPAISPPRCPPHFDRLAICASIGLAGGGMSAICMRSAITAVS